MDHRPLAADWPQFASALFERRDARRLILLQWLRLKTPMDGRPANDLQHLLRTILQESFDFHLRSDCILVLGQRYPIRLEWLPTECFAFCKVLFTHPDAAFGVRKECENGQFDYGQPTSPAYVPAALLGEVRRMQLARDVVQIINGLRCDALTLELIAALQWMLADAAGLSVGIRRFLRDTLAALQGVCELAEVMCVE